jgi:hypothetical protein
VTNPAIFEDAFNMLCGEKLGSGIHRDVFACKLRPELVVKVERFEDYRTFSNVREWLFWDDWQHVQAVAKWLAPIEYISPDARVILQRRADPIRQSDIKDVKKLPGFLTDIKPRNFGILDGKLVCVDYGYVISSKPNTRLKSIDWGD